MMFQVHLRCQASCSIWVCLLLACLNVPGQASKADEATLEKLRREAPIAWERTRQAYSGKEFIKKGKRQDSISVFGLLKEVVVSGEMRDVEIERVINNLRIRRKLIIKKPTEAPKEIKQNLKLVPRTTQGTAIVNKWYTGDIVEGASPIVESFQLLLDDETSAALSLEFDYETMPALRLGDNAVLDRSIIGFPHFVLAKNHPNYVINDAEEFTSESGDVLVRVTLDLGILENGELESVSKYFKEGVVVLDPARDWSQVEYHHKSDNREPNPDMTVDVVVTTSPEPDEFHPSKMETRVVWSDGSLWHTVEEFTKLTDTDLRVSDCYFSAYGLPEPPGYRRSRFLTGGLIAIVCVLLILVVRRRLTAEKIASD